jgi:hypothetical protein
MSLKIADILLELLANGVRFYGMKHLVDLFFSKEECSWKYSWMLYFAACFWTSLVYDIFRSPALNIVSNLIGLFLILLPYRVKLSRKFLLIFMIYAVNVLVDSIIVLSFTNYTVGEPVPWLCEAVTSLMILLLAILFERTMRPKNDTNLPDFYRGVLGMVPIISIFCIYAMVMMVARVRKPVLIITAGILCINIIIFYLYDSLIQFYSGYLEKKKFEKIAEIYAYQLDLLKESQERMSGLRHDMRHHIIELSAMAKENKMPEIMDYLKDMEKFMLNPKEHVSTGNQEVDGILNYLLQKADKALAKVEVKISIPKKGDWTNFNICVILGNLVDNAIREAAKSEEKYLSIRLQLKRGIFLLFVENSYSGQIMEKDNKFKTSQPDTAIHGIGLKNVKNIVAKEEGELNISYTKERFKVEVMMYLPEKV